MAASSALHRFITSRLNYAQVKIDGPMQRSVDDAMGDILPVILTTIRKMPKITVPEMTSIAETLSASIMPSNVQKEVLETIDAKVNQGSPGKKQEIDCPELWQSRQGWTVYNNRNEPTYTRVHAMASRLKVVGGVRLTEPTFARAAAIVLHADGPQEVPEMLKHTRDLKLQYECVSSQHQFEGPDKYPTNPMEIQETHPQLWEQISTDGEVVPSGIDAGIAEMLKKLSVCRNSKMGMNRQPSSQQLAVPSRSTGSPGQRQPTSTSWAQRLAGRAQPYRPPLAICDVPDRHWQLPPFWDPPANYWQPRAPRPANEHIGRHVPAARSTAEHTRSAGTAKAREHIGRREAPARITCRFCEARGNACTTKRN